MKYQLTYTKPYVDCDVFGGKEVRTSNETHLFDAANDLEAKEIVRNFLSEGVFKFTPVSPPFRLGIHRRIALTLNEIRNVMSVEDLAAVNELPLQEEEVKWW